MCVFQCDHMCFLIAAVLAQAIAPRIGQITETPYQSPPSLGRITDTPYQGAPSFGRITDPPNAPAAGFAGGLQSLLRTSLRSRVSMLSRGLQTLEVQYRLWTLRPEVLQRMLSGTRTSLLLDALLDLPKLQHFLVRFASVPDLRDGNSCGQVITDPPYQGAPNLGRITDPPYQGAQTLLCQMRQASMTIANVISFKAAFSICKAGTRTTTKPRIHRQHLRLAEADSQKKIRKRWRQQACAEEDKERAEDTKRGQSSMSTGLFVQEIWIWR